MAPARTPPVAAVAFAACATGFVLAAGPSVGVRDAGELTTAAFLVDVPHPTGFPADMVALRLAMLLPIGDVAFRANVMTALWMALACALAAHLAYVAADGLAAIPRTALALAAASVLALSPTVLRAGTATEVYALSLAVALAAMGRIAVDGEAPANRRVAAVVLGATLLVHTGARPAALVALAVLVAPALARAGRVRTIAAVVACGVAGALPVFYLPVAAHAHRYIDWGDPSTPSRLLAHLTATRIRGAFASRMFVAWRIPDDLAHVATVLREDLGVIVLVIGVAGAIVAARHRVVRWVAVLALIDVTYATLVNAMGVGDRQVLFVAEASLVVLAAHAVARAARSVKSERAATGLVLALAVFAVAARARAFDRSFAARADGWTASEVLGGAGALGDVPVHAIVLSESDDLSGVAMYAQRVEGERPDVTALPRQHLADPSTWRRVRRGALGDADGVSDARGDLRVARLRWIVGAFAERVRWEAGEVDDERIAGVVLGSAETPVLAAVNATVGAVDLDAWSWLAPRVAAGEGARRVAAVILDGAGRRVAREGLARAAPLWERARSVDPTDATAWTNLGVVRASEGDVRGAIAMTEQAVALDAERVTAWRNLARYRAAIGDLDGAREAAREVERRARP